MITQTQIPIGPIPQKIVALPDAGPASLAFGLVILVLAALHFFRVLSRRKKPTAAEAHRAVTLGIVLAAVPALFWAWFFALRSIL